MMKIMRILMIFKRRETAVLKTSLKSGAEKAKEACTPRLIHYDDDDDDVDDDVDVDDFDDDDVDENVQNYTLSGI